MIKSQRHDSQQLALTKKPQDILNKTQISKRYYKDMRNFRNINI